MSNIETVKAALGDFAKDVRLNLSTVLTPEGAPDLTESQIAMVALASAYATRHPQVMAALEAHTTTLTSEEKTAAKTAASVMAMNNVYYRFVHSMAEGSAYKTLPAKLRMQGLAAHGIAKADFELMATAVSAINGCAMCMEAHAHTLETHGVTPLAVQSAVRIAAVVQSVAQALVIGPSA